REEARIGLAGRAEAGQRLLADLEEGAPRLPRIDDGAAEEEGGGAGHREERCRDQAPGRGFGDGERLAALAEPGGDPLGGREEFLHRPISGFYRGGRVLPGRGGQSPAPTNNRLVSALRGCRGAPARGGRRSGSSAPASPRNCASRPPRVACRPRR